MERILLMVPVGSASSEIIVTRGLPTPLLPTRQGRTASAILTQPGAAKMAGRVSELLLEAPVRELPDRDKAKSMDVVGEVYQWLAGIQLGRQDTLIGVGGGAVTDTAGFVGATWLRGIEVVLVPTTLLAAVDAAIGGKTGINLGGKNLVGAFHLPSRVVIDLDVLDQTPAELQLEGAAEAIKAGLIGDPKLVDLYEQHGLAAPLDEIVARAVAVKVEVVGSDYREGGRRAILNLGHTIGHAIELTAGLGHGPAVAVGMAAAGAISASRYGFDDRWLTDLLENLGLPVSVRGVDREEVLALIGHDKKRIAEGIRMVLLRAVGEPVVDLVNEDELALGLESVGIGRE